jgi:hypothetical protein
VGAVAEQLARFRGIRQLEERHLTRFGRRLALATFALAEDAGLVDLDDPRVLQRRRLRPSEVATRERAVTQRHAAEAFALAEEPAGLRWWSTLESSWINVTLFAQATRSLPLEVAQVRALELDDLHVRAAADFLGFR